MKRPGRSNPCPNANPKLFCQTLNLSLNPNPYLLSSVLASLLSLSLSWHDDIIYLCLLSVSWLTLYIHICLCLLSLSLTDLIYLRLSVSFVFVFDWHYISTFVCVFCLCLWLTLYICVCLCLLSLSLTGMIYILCLLSLSWLALYIYV